MKCLVRNSRIADKIVAIVNRHLSLRACHGLEMTVSLPENGQCLKLAVDQSLVVRSSGLSLSCHAEGLQGLVRKN